MKSLNISALTTLLIIFYIPAQSASFDCGKARSQVEKAVCSSNDLSKLDEAVADAYRLAIKEHPVENYVRARQREWIKDNNFCDKSNFSGCLKSRYEKRLSQLKTISSAMIFSSSKKFDYSNGDAVAEIWQHEGKYRIYVWGGFRVHRQLSTDSGKPVYTGCEFEGSFTSQNGGEAIGLINGEIKGGFDFTIDGARMSYSDDAQICEGGFARLPEALALIRK